MTPPLLQQVRLTKPLAARPTEEQGLSRDISTFALMMFGVGSTVGTGIFFVLQEAVPDAGPAVVISFVLAGIAAGLSALNYSELASSMPVSGSSYSYAYHGLGEGVAMLIGACVLLEYGVAASAVAVGWSGYFNELTDQVLGVRLPDALSYSPLSVDGSTTGILNLPAIVLVTLCALLLVRGASESARVNTIMVLIKLGALGMFIVLAFTAFQVDRFEHFFDSGIHGVATAAGTIFFSFIGLDAISTAGEEVKDPQRALPRALIGALGVVITVYVLVAISGVGSQPLEKFSSTEQESAGMSVMLDDITGSAVPGTVLAAGAVISIFSVTLISMYGQTRVLFAMARDRMLPDRFAEVNPKTLTPTYNTVVVAIVVGGIAGFVPSDYLWDTVSIGTLMAFIVVATGVLVLRRTQPDMERPFKVPGFPVVPVLTIVICLYVLSGLPTITWLIFLSWIAVAVAYYLLYARHRSRLIGPDAASETEDRVR